MRAFHRLALFVTALAGLSRPLTSQVIDARRPDDRLRPADATADMPPGYELRCRGGEGAFRWSVADLRPRAPGGVTLRLRFNKSARAAGAAGEGLDPGTCSWIDRPINDAEPLVLQLEVAAHAQPGRAEVDSSPTAAEHFPDADTIPAYLRVPSHYWSFFAHNTNQGYFITTGHQVWPAEKGQALARAQGPATTSHGDSLRTGRPRTVTLEVRYKRSYGRRKTASAFGDSPGLCSGYAVGVTPRDPAQPIGIPVHGRLTEADAGYFCEYEVSGVPLDVPMTVTLTVTDPTAAWDGGSEAQPPPGMRRVVLEPTRTVTLTRRRPWATLRYEMVYAPQ